MSSLREKAFETFFCFNTMMGIRKLPQTLAGTSDGEFHLLRIRELDDDDVGGTPNSADEETSQTSALANELWCSKRGVGISLVMTALPGISSCKSTNFATKMVKVTQQDL